MADDPVSPEGLAFRSAPSVKTAVRYITATPADPPELLNDVVAEVSFWLVHGRLMILPDDPAKNGC